MSLTAEGLTFRYGRGPDVVRDVSLAVAPGERVALVAPSGTGKTTVGRLLTGHLTPRRGRVLVDGTPAPRTGHHPVQLIWQHPDLAVNPLLRLGETLAEGGAVDPRIMRGLGIEQAWLGRFPRELSAGEIQRICIARALGPRTRYLVADEITTMLDPLTRAALWAFLVEETERRRIGVLVVTHDDALADAVCHRRIGLDQSVVPRGASDHHLRNVGAPE